MHDSDEDTSLERQLAELVYTAVYEEEDDDLAFARVKEISDWIGLITEPEVDMTLWSPAEREVRAMIAHAIGWKDSMSPEIITRLASLWRASCV